LNYGTNIYGVYSVLPDLQGAGILYPLTAGVALSTSSDEIRRGYAKAMQAGIHLNYGTNREAKLIIFMISNLISTCQMPYFNKIS
jgi:hypothetical protein